MRGGRGATLSFDGGDGEMDGFLRLASSTSSPRLVFGVRQSDRSTASATNGDAAATPAAAATDTTDDSAAAPACVRGVLQIDGEGRALLGAQGSDETAAAALHVRGQSRATRADEATTCNDGERAGLGQLDSTVMGQVVAPDAVAVFEGASDVSTMTNPTNPTNALGAAVQVVGAAGATSTAAAASLVLSAVAGCDSISAPGWSLPGERRGVSHWVMSSSFDGEGDGRGAFTLSAIGGGWKATGDAGAGKDGLEGGQKEGEEGKQEGAQTVKDHTAVKDRVVALSADDRGWVGVGTTELVAALTVGGAVVSSHLGFISQAGSEVTAEDVNAAMSIRMARVRRLTAANAAVAAAAAAAAQQDGTTDSTPAPPVPPAPVVGGGEDEALAPNAPQLMSSLDVLRRLRSLDAVTYVPASQNIYIIFSVAKYLH